VPELRILARRWTALGQLFQAENRIAQSDVPFQSCIGMLGVDFLVQADKVALGTSGEINEICHE
jgi:hypothetical protein